MSTLYHTKDWRELRALALERDGSCFLSGIAGECRGALQVHHVDPVSEGGPEIPNEDGVVTVCTRHHRMLHGFLNRSKRWKTCPHQHRTREARRQCEERLNQAA